MIYQARVKEVVAQPVQLGPAALFAVAVDGSAHLVDAAVFRLFFEAAAVAEELPAKAAPVLKSTASITKRPKPPVKKATPMTMPGKSVGPKVDDQPKKGGVSASNTGIGSQAAALQAIQEQARTSGEVVDRVCILCGWDKSDKRARDRGYQALMALREAGKVEKKDDPATQIPFWRPVRDVLGVAQ